MGGAQMTRDDPGDTEPSEAGTQSLGELYNCLRAETKGDLYPPGRKVQASVATFCIVRDHHLAVTILLESDLCASAFALTRPVVRSDGQGYLACALCHRSEGRKLR